MYLIGGTNELPALLERQYEVPKSTIKINIQSGLMKQCANMIKDRYAMGICNIGERIYCFGGISTSDEIVRKDCEFYDILKN